MDTKFNKKKLFSDVILDIIDESSRKKKPMQEYPQVQFDVPSSFEIINKASEILKEEPSILQIDTKDDETEFIIVGDIHGSIESLLKIFKEKGYPPSARYLFLGDYVDRGFRSIEVMIMLYSLKCLFPKYVYLIRGNHEFKNMTDFYGFKTECLKRIKSTFHNDICYSSFAFYKLMTESFVHLPLGAILNDSIFCVHGGVTSFIKNREELLNLNKIGNQFFECDLAQAEMLWNDPDKYVLNYCKSKRGRGSIFGVKAVDTFLNDLNFKLIVRGHQNVFDGFDWPFGRKGGILTVFSAIDYCNSSNIGGIAIIKKENEIKDDNLVDIHQIDNYPRFDGGVDYCFWYQDDIL